MGSKRPSNALVAALLASLLPITVAAQWTNYPTPGIPRLPDGKPGAKGNPDYVVEACDNSLKRLATDYIDLYLLHQPDPTTPIGETLSAFAKLVAAGKVHDARNTGSTPVKVLATYIVEKGKPLATPAP